MSDSIDVLKTYKTYVGGNFPRSESGRTYNVCDNNGQHIANACQCSRKDFRDAVVAARSAQPGWASRSAYNRGQILYRIAEMLQGRRAQFIDEMKQIGVHHQTAQKEVQAAINCFIYFAGWADKYQQVFGTINPVASDHFNFSMCEPMGVVSAYASEESPLLGLAAAIAPTIVGGNSIVVLASKQYPLTAISFAEVLHTSDVPAGVINVLTGFKEELLDHFTSHMDVNAFLQMDAATEQNHRKQIDENAALNVKCIISEPMDDWSSYQEDPYLITKLQETKTTWHPVAF